MMIDQSIKTTIFEMSLSALRAVIDTIRERGDVVFIDMLTDDDVREMDRAYIEQQQNMEKLNAQEIT